MNIPDTHIVRLRFKIDNDAPKEYMNRWNTLKKDCEYNNDNETELIVKEWLAICKNETIRNLPYLNRSEGGIGGNNNKKHKQIRFRPLENILSFRTDNDIVFDVSNTNEEKWSFDELDDLIYGFIKFSNKYVMADCIKGIIEMVNKNSIYDDYLE